LFTELPLLKRPEAARAAGFDAVEFWWPFADPVPGDREVDAFTGALADAGVQLALLNFAGGDMAAGDRGLMGLPEGRPRSGPTSTSAPGSPHGPAAPFSTRCTATAPTAFPGSSRTSWPRRTSRWPPAAAAAGATVVVEALNSYDSPRAALVSSRRALEVIDLVRAQAGVTNVAFLADLYHLGKMGEDLPATLAREAASIAHIQIADVPDRGAPGTGELDYEALFGQLAAQAYAGWIGCEYKPSDPADSSTSFGWREPDEV
jgi:Hydroxypyruvate isomerase